MTKEEVIKAYVWIRENNHTIPDEILDLMKNSAIEKLENKWIKIECEADLPKERGNYHIFTKDGEVSIGLMSITDTYIKRYWIENITHYQQIEKIEKPKPPIY